MTERMLLADRQDKQKGSALLQSLLLYGAQTRNRTTDTRIFNPLLYRLSYLGEMVPAIGIELMTY